MTDTPKHIHELQLKLWLSKPPEERLMQFIMDNDIMFRGIMEAKEKMKIKEALEEIIKFLLRYNRQ